jgi:hypothetical protein
VSSKTLQCAAIAITAIVFASTGCGGRVSVGSLQADGSSSSGDGGGSSTAATNGPGDDSGTSGGNASASDSGASSDGGCPDIPTLFASSTCSTTEGCHGASNAGPTSVVYGLDLVSPNVASRLVGVPSAEIGIAPVGTLLIDPANPGMSAMYTKVTANPTYGLPMPFGRPLLDIPTQMCILQWVTRAASGSAGNGSDAGTSGGGGSGSSSGGVDSGNVFDATGGLGAPPLGLAGFAFVINGVARRAMACPSENWEFAPFPTSADSACNPNFNQVGCPGVTSVSLINTGKVSVAYYATNVWNGGYVPGVATGAPIELAGVMNPGASVNITSVFSGGLTALLGSAQPFSSPNSGKYAFDEGTIPWPKGVQGSGGSATMYVAQIEVAAACMKSVQEW